MESIGPIKPTNLICTFHFWFHISFFVFEPNSQLETIGEGCFEYCVFKSIKFYQWLSFLQNFYHIKNFVSDHEFFNDNKSNQKKLYELFSTEINNKKI